MVIQNRHKFDELTGKSTPMKLVFQRIKEIASNDITVLITGESGTGKELVAQSIHNRSNRAAGPFIPLNTGAISRELVASELFGHQKGAFTGATETKLGKFEQARGGTLFLDEISSMDEATQISLLRVLDTKKFQRIGGHRFINTDVRIIAASNENLLNEVQRKIRKDLFHRLCVFTINLPPLRERNSDIEILAAELVDNAGEEFKKSIIGFDRQALFALKRYNWPGNIREMKNVIQRAVLICTGKTIKLEHLPDRIRDASQPQREIVVQVGMTLKQAEHIIIRNTIDATGGNRKKAAEILGISRRALYNKLKKQNSDLSE